eukprot:scaffold71702_cov66-Attheya_sp.AAC.1
MVEPTALRLHDNQPFRDQLGHAENKLKAQTKAHLMKRGGPDPNPNPSLIFCDHGLGGIHSLYLNVRFSFEFVHLLVQ